MAAQPGNEGTVRHIQFDENGDEIEDFEPLQTAEEDLQDVDDDDQEVVEVGSGTKKRKKKGASSKSSRTEASGASLKSPSKNGLFCIDFRQSRESNSPP